MKEYKYDKVIVGNTLYALAKAYYSGTPILVKGCPQYHYFDTIGALEKSLLWKRYAFHLSMAGLMPFGEKIENIYILDNSLSIITKGNKRYEVSSGEIEEIVYEKSLDESGIVKCEVFDWFSVKSGRVHAYKEIKVNRDNIKKILFYDLTKAQYKDLVTLSVMLKGEEEEGNNSELMTKFQVLDVMKSAGIRGTKNGVGRKGIQVYLNLKIEHMHRDIRPLNNVDETELILSARSASNSLTKDIADLADKFGNPLDESGI